MSESAMDSAKLSVVQPGTRQSFKRRVMDAMRSLVPAPATFFAFGTNESLAYREGTRVVDGSVKAFAGKPVPLSEAFGFDAKSLVISGRRAYLADELYPDSERKGLDYFVHTASDGLTRALFVFLHEGGVLFGVAGLERRESDPPFSQEDASKLETLAPFVVTQSRAQIAYDDLSREASALRAHHRTTATLVVVDRDKGTVLWAANRERGVDFTAEIEPHTKVIVDAAERSFEARTRGEALPTPPALPFGTVAGVAKLEGDPVFGGARCAVLRVESMEKAGPQPLDGLSKREREIARLLVAGYSGVNVAAIAGLSENTVRTYVRRLYAKIGVSNRADLVRKLVSPEPNSSRQNSSVLSPPPDSSLAEGDDTLD